MCLPYIKFSDPLPEPHLFFIWPNYNHSFFSFIQKKKHPLGAGILSHLDPFLARFSLESYKAAMYNPILPNIPEHCGIEGIEVHTNSSSVISLDDDDEESHVSYYQPPEPGSTSILYNETGKLLRETGV